MSVSSTTPTNGANGESRTPTGIFSPLGSEPSASTSSATLAYLKMVPGTGLEPARPLWATGISFRRVYQFHHPGKEGMPNELGLRSERYGASTNSATSPHAERGGLEPPRSFDHRLCRREPNTVGPASHGGRGENRTLKPVTATALAEQRRAPMPTALPRCPVLIGTEVPRFSPGGDDGHRTGRGGARKNRTSQHYGGGVTARWWSQPHTSHPWWPR